MGKMYAETILAAEPDNADANFAMGMYYLKENQLTRAEEYLKRCLVRKPNEPAVYNNLAMIQLTLGKLDAAEINVQKALKLIPGSAAVIDTQKAIEKAREAKAAGKGR
jgi:Tfp pilus assembly protein PilF